MTFVYNFESIQVDGEEMNEDHNGAEPSHAGKSQRRLEIEEMCSREKK